MIIVSFFLGNAPELFRLLAMTFATLRTLFVDFYRNGLALSI